MSGTRESCVVCSVRQAVKENQPLKSLDCLPAQRRSVDWWSIRLCRARCGVPSNLYIDLYLIDTPGEFTREKLKAYKSLEAYNYCAKMNGFTISVLDLIQSQLEIGSAVSADLSPEQPTLYIYPIAVCIIIQCHVLFFSCIRLILLRVTFSWKKRYNNSYNTEKRNLNNNTLGQICKSSSNNFVWGSLD